MEKKRKKKTVLEVNFQYFHLFKPQIFTINSHKFIIYENNNDGKLSTTQKPIKKKYSEAA